MTIVEIVYPTAKAPLTNADFHAFLDVLDNPESSFEIAPVDGATARQVTEIARETVPTRSTA